MNTLLCRFRYILLYVNFCEDILICCLSQLLNQFVLVRFYLKNRQFLLEHLKTRNMKNKLFSYGWVSKVYGSCFSNLVCAIFQSSEKPRCKTLYVFRWLCFVMSQPCKKWNKYCFLNHPIQFLSPSIVLQLSYIIVLLM